MLFALTALLVGFAVAETTVAQEYKLQLDRPVKVGDKMDVSVLGAGRWTTTVTVSGKDPRKREEAYGVSLEGQLEALEVDNKGNSTKAALTIQSCQKVTNSAQKDLLDKGTVVIAEVKGEKTEYSLKDAGGVSPEIERALQLVFELHDPRLAGDDAMLGTSEPKKVGDTWNVNGDVLAKDLTTVGLPVKAADVTGKVTLLKTVKSEGIDALVIQAQFGVTKMQGDLPEGAKLQEGKLDAKFMSTLPVDVTMQPTSETSITKLSTVATSKDPDGIEMKIETTIERNVEGKFKPSK